MGVTPATGITSIHHLTAVSADAQRTVDFYTKLLGLRLVEQTVDLDDPGAYQLAFADEEGGPGTLVFIERKGAPRGRFGIGGTHHLAFATRDRHTLRQWKRWLTDRGVPVSGPYNRVYFESIYFSDPDGLILEIATRGPGWTWDEAPEELGRVVKPPPLETTAGHRDEAAIAADTWPEPVPAPTPEMRLRQMHHITAIGSDAGRIEDFFSGLLGMRMVKRTVNFDDPSSPHLYFGIGAGEPGTIVTYFAYPPSSMRSVRPGAGITDHFALSVPDVEALAAWRDHLGARGIATTPLREEVSHASIALHDPDGLVVELATAAPGFTADVAPADIGRTLRLPPRLETQRRDIERHLKPLAVPEPAGR